MGVFRGFLKMTKIRAFTAHVSYSVLIFIFFLGIMFFIWYPHPYFEISGGWEVLGILAGVDVVLGPILTLIVFKPGKPSLKFDMSIIVLTQLSALIYGGLIIYQQRPAFVVFAVDRFTTISAADVEYGKLKYPGFQSTNRIGPRLVYARRPDDPKLREELMFGVLFEGKKDLEFRAEFYEPYRPDLDQLRTRSLNLVKIAALDADAKQALDSFTMRTGGQIVDYLYFPLRGKNKDIVIVLSAKDGMPVSYLSISPWISDYPAKP